MLLQRLEDHLHQSTNNTFTADSKISKPRKWACKLPETLLGDYFIVPLTTVGLLKSESQKMNNESINYAHRCANLDYCIYSIRRRTGERLATLGLFSEDGYWQFDWCSGPSNIEVLEESVEYLDDEGILQAEHYPTELYYVAHEVVRLMNADVCN